MNDDHSFSSSSSRTRSPRLRSSPIIFQSPAISTSQIEEELKVPSPETYEKHIGCNKQNQCATQKDAFRAWIDYYCPGLIEKDLVEELRDGIKLIGLLSHLTGDERLRCYYRKLTSRVCYRGSLDSPQSLTYHPTTKAKRLANVVTALDYMKRSGINLVNVNPMDIVDGRSTVVMGLIWTLILHYQNEQNLKHSFAWSRCSSIMTSCEDFVSEFGVPELLITDVDGQDLSVDDNSNGLSNRTHKWPFESQSCDFVHGHLKRSNDNHHEFHYDIKSLDIDLDVRSSHHQAEEESELELDLIGLDDHNYNMCNGHSRDIESLVQLVKDNNRTIDEPYLKSNFDTLSKIPPISVKVSYWRSWPSVRALWNKIVRAFKMSSSLNIMLLIVVAGLCMLPLVQKDNCCELTPGYLNPAIYANERKPV